MLTPDDKATLEDYLKRSGYASVDEWAEDSDFIKVGNTWWDEDDNPTNPEEYLLTLIRELGL